MNLSEPSPSSEHSDSGLLSGDTAFHNQIKNVIFDVEIPEGLKDSVLASLNQSDVNSTGSDDSAVLSRRRFLKKPAALAGLSACLMFAMLLTYFWAAQTPVIALSEFSPELNLDSRLLADFDNHFSARLPAQGGWHLKGRLIFVTNNIMAFL